MDVHQTWSDQASVGIDDRIGSNARWRAAAHHPCDPIAFEHDIGTHGIIVVPEDDEAARDQGSVPTRRHGVTLVAARRTEVAASMPWVASWAELEHASPTVAGLVRESLERGRHKTMATLRRDGSPRISGVELQVLAGELWLGSMPGSLKAGDLRRDPRVAVHSASPDPSPADPTDWVGDAKVSGTAAEVTDPATRAVYLAGLSEEHGHEMSDDMDFDLFRIDITEAVATRIAEDRAALDLSIWSVDDGERIVRRE